MSNQFKMGRFKRRTDLLKPRPRFETKCSCGETVKLRNDRTDPDKLYLSCPKCKRVATLKIKREPTTIEDSREATTTD